MLEFHGGGGVQGGERAKYSGLVRLGIAGKYPMAPASSLRTTAELTTALGALQSAETEVTASLAALLASSNPINAALNRLNRLTPKLDEVGKEASVLHRNVERTAQTADRVGSRVKALDEEMRRVREASERVAMVMELKVSQLSAVLSDLTAQIVVVARVAYCHRCARVGSSCPILCSRNGHPRICY